MKRGGPLNRKTQLRQRRASGPDIEREPRPRAKLPAPLATPARARVGGSTTGPVPKSAPYRDAALLEMAKGRPCLLLVPGVCSHRIDTVVAAHSNLGAHGKAGARKADDLFSCWSCAACHRWLDQPIGHGGPSYEQKCAAFMAGHALQVLAWRQVAADPSEPERFRCAARRALELLNATPMYEEGR